MKEVNKNKLTDIILLSFIVIIFLICVIITYNQIKEIHELRINMLNEITSDKINFPKVKMFNYCIFDNQTFKWYCIDEVNEKCQKK